MAKTKDIRPVITLECSVCKNRNYATTKSTRNDPDRMVLKKWCKHCRQITEHRENR